LVGRIFVGSSPFRENLSASLLFYYCFEINDALKTFSSYTIYEEIKIYEERSTGNALVQVQPEA